MANELDVVKLLVRVSGESEVENKEVSFPAGTEGTIVHINGEGHLVEIQWLTSPLSEDGLLVWLTPDQFEVIEKNKSK